MGWTNLVPIFHDNITHILQPEIPDTTIPFIDDVLIWGPPTQYKLPNSGFEKHPENPHFQGLNQVVHPDQIAAQDDLRSALLKSPALWPIDYGSAANVILAIDTSQITINNMFPTSDSTSTTAIFTSSLIGDLPTKANSNDEGPTIDYLDIPKLQKALEAEECLWLIVAAPSSRITIPTAAHNDVAHKGFYATTALVAKCFWWPHMRQDISWFVRTYHLCQIHQTHNILIPPTVTTPAPLFAKMYMDTMHMPTAGGFKYFIQGTLVEIVSNNGPAFVKALNQLAKKYHIQHIRISGYNSRTNSIAKRPHFDIRQALFKAIDGDQAKWNRAAYFIFWADCITIQRRMGCLPYFTATRTHPLLPLDIAKATYLLPPPTTILSTTDLIA
ncbi:hypothetical protein HETIRDRAFT_119482 [Heterobasidion irregulare TC 32-1]|uniref:Integrase zinc-binding domain-containing protein n=1 Tax=Heterobasidion irregulare (strain TC 32-1) TaxID=747525 RepID=W4KC66_HETIT|nr:uncharacterized protein HETIRDRAFT_119482 [Heterobasidion irregulare TC 32-1]ETW83358.1 hypothetical protein HETIRDRAFT_119482 [Heterobasidion irregulare TC 32-1]